MPIDPYANFSSGLESPYENAIAITPDDDNDLPVIPRAFGLVSVATYA